MREKDDGGEKQAAATDNVIKIVNDIPVSVAEDTVSQVLMAKKVNLTMLHKRVLGVLISHRWRTTNVCDAWPM